MAATEGQVSRERLQQHTSGPWAITDRPDPDRAEPEFFNIESGTENDDGWIVARVWADAPELSLRADANARLIAAAPDLLAVTQWIVAFMDEHPDWTEQFFTEGGKGLSEVEWLDAARAAIAKATGTETVPNAAPLVPNTTAGA